MRKRKMYFEQVPVRTVKDLIVVGENQVGAENSASEPSLLYCGMCHKVVPIEIAKTDGQGWAVHEECYLASVKLESNGPRLVRQSP
jgi:hypothetical protein